jgi:hypothetical protein
VRGTRKEAEREVGRVVVKVDEGRHVASAPIELAELLDRWLDVKRRMVEASTLSSYEWIARTYIRPARCAQGGVAAADRPGRTVRVASCAWALGSHRAHLPHRDAPVTRAGSQVGCHRPQPCRRCHATTPAPARGRATECGAGARAAGGGVRLRGRLRHLPVDAGVNGMSAWRSVRAALERHRPRPRRARHPTVGDRRRRRAA